MNVNKHLRQVWNDSKIFLVGFLALVGLVIGINFTYNAVVQPLSSGISIEGVKAEDKNEKAELSYSMYDMSAWLSAYYNAATSPSGYKTLKKGDGDYGAKALLTKAAVEGAKDGKEGWDYATMTWLVKTGDNGGKVGGGGSLLGFPDKNVVDGGIMGFLSSLTSSTTTDYSFESLRTGDSYNSLQSYAYYGASLQSLGIDSVMGNGLLGFHPVRLLAGATMWISYIIVSFIEKFFLVAVAILKATNPFKWFANGFSYIWRPGSTGPLSGLTNVVSTTYKVFANFGWLIMVPVVISSLIFMFIFSGNGKQSPQLDQRRKHKFRYAVIYFFFLTIGVPLLGTAYTAGLDSMADAFGKGFGSSSFSADSVILSTYVDNQKWIENNRMYLPSSAVVVWDKEAGDSSSESKAAVRQTALAINALNYGAARDASNATDADSWNYTKEATDTGANTANISALLWRYMSGETYSPGTWETKVKSYLLEKAEGSDGKEWTDKLSSSALELTSREGYQYLGYINPNVTGENHDGVKVNDSWWKFWQKDNKEITFGASPNLFLDKGYADLGDGGITIVEQYDSKGNASKYLSLKSNPSIGNDGRALFSNQDATMSYLEMYNYLNTKFSSNKLSVYSTKMLVSNATRESHATVNQVGAGMVHKTLIFINSIAMLAGLAILAMGYAFGMVIGALKRYVSLISSIFLGTVGFQKGMVQAIAGTIMLIAETLGTLVIYEIIKTLYIGIPSIVEGAIVSTGLGSKNDAAGETLLFATKTWDMTGVDFILVVVGLILSSIILIWATIVLLRIRKPILNVMDTTFTDLINRLFYGEGNVPGDAPKGVNPQSGGMIGKVASATGGALLGAAQSNIDGLGDLTGQGDVNPDDPNNPNGPNGGPDGPNGPFGGAGVGPDAKVASRETENVGSQLGADGKLNRDSSGITGVTGISGISAMGGETGQSDVMGSVGAISSAVSGGSDSASSLMDGDVTGVSSVTSIGGDLSSSSSVSSLSDSVLSSDSNVSPMSDLSSVANMSSTGDVSANGDVMSSVGTAVSAGAGALVGSDGKSQSYIGQNVNASSETQSSVSSGEHSVSSGENAKNMAEGASKTAEGATDVAKGSSDVVAGSSRAMAGDVTGAMQAVKGAKQTISGAGKIKDGSSQMVEGAKGMAESTTDGAVNTASSEMTNVASSSTATANSYGNVNSSQNSYSKSSVSSPDSKGSKELVKSGNSANPKSVSGTNAKPVTGSTSKPTTASGSRQTVARRDASRPDSKPLASNSSRQGSGQQSASRANNVTPIASNPKMDTVKSVISKGQQGYRQAQKFANSPTGKVARAAMDARKDGGHLKREVSRTVNATVTSSAGRTQPAMNDYYYNQATPQNNAQPVSRPTGNSLEERSRQQRERSDARIRRTKRPS